MPVGGYSNLDLRGAHGSKFMRTELGLWLSNDLGTSNSHDSTRINAVFYSHIEQLETRERIS